MTDRSDNSKHSGGPPLSTMIWTVIALTIGFGTLLYWLIGP